MSQVSRPTLEDVRAAARVIDGVARVSPAFRSETFTRRCGRPVMLKAETLQRTGSFKVRGALNRVAALTESERRAGVVLALEEREVRLAPAAMRVVAPVLVHAQAADHAPLTQREQELGRRVLVERVTAAVELRAGVDRQRRHPVWMPAVETRREVEEPAPLAARRDVDRLDGQHSGGPGAPTTGR